MLKKIILGLILLFIQINTNGQEQDSTNIGKDRRLEILSSYQLFGGGFGFIVKGKREILHSKHFEAYAGLAYQTSYQFETDVLLNGVTGYQRDLGIYLVTDLMYYPFKTKKVFTGLEPYVGLTVLKSKGTLVIPEYGIDEVYTNRYAYLNYGTTQTLGYNFGRVSVSLFTMLSLKGLLDQGRTRPGDSDSKIFVGINLGFKLKPKK